MRRAVGLLLGFGIVVALTGTLWAKVVCTTTALEVIYERLTGEKCEIIASPAVCPAHYDLKPSDLEKARGAELILSHGVEPWVTELAKISNAKVLKVSGAWNNPPALREAYKALADELQRLGKRVDLEGALRAVDVLDGKLKEFAEEHGFRGVPVVCMQWQKGFVEYLGFKVLAFYPPPEMLSAKNYEEVLQRGKGAQLVIDNLQSGTELGLKLAEKLGASHVVLSNFPLDGDLEAMMIENARKLADALERRKGGEGER